MESSKPGSSKMSEGSLKRSEVSSKRSEVSSKRSEVSSQRSEVSSKRSEGSSKGSAVRSSSLESKLMSCDVSQRQLVAADVRQHHEVFNANVSTHASDLKYRVDNGCLKRKPLKPDEQQHSRTKEQVILMMEEEPVLKGGATTSKARDSHPYHLVNLQKKQSRFKSSKEVPNDSEQITKEEESVLKAEASISKARDSHYFYLSNLQKKSTRFVPAKEDPNESEQIKTEGEPILKPGATTSNARDSRSYHFANLRKKSPRFVPVKENPNVSEHNTSEEEPMKGGATTSKSRDSHPYHFINLRKKKTHFALTKEYLDESGTKVKSSATLKEVRFESDHEEVPDKEPDVSKSPKQGGSQSKSDTATSEKGSNSGKPVSASHVPKSADGKSMVSIFKSKSASRKPKSANDFTDLKEDKPSSSKGTPSAPSSMWSGASTSSAGQHDAGTTPSNYRTTFETWQPGKQKVVCPKCHQLMVPIFRRSKNLADTIFKPSCLMSCWPCVLLPFVNNSGLGQIRMFCVNCKSLIGVFNPDKGMFEEPPVSHGSNQDQ